TVVQQVVQPDTIVFSKPTASTIIGSGYPPRGNESIQGNLLAFSDPQGNPVGFFDGPASGNWVQELCDVDRRWDSHCGVRTRSVNTAPTQTVNYETNPPVPTKQDHADRPDFHRELCFTRRFARKGREIAPGLRRMG